MIYPSIQCVLARRSNAHGSTIIMTTNSIPDLNSTHPKKGKIVELHQPCPSCSSSDAFCSYDDGHGWCFACNYYKPRDKREFMDAAYTYEYVPYRGIDHATLQFYDVKTKVDATGKPISIGFAYSNGSYKIRTLDKKGFYTQGDISKAGLFGRNRFPAGSHKYVTITEGELDALSLHQVVRSPVVSVQSSSSAVSDCAVDRAYLNSFERIYLAFDGDEAGRQAASRVAKLFDYNKVYQLNFPGGDRKDANDFVANGAASELRQIWWNAKRFLPETIISSQHIFEKILAEVPKSGVSYPFPTLTYMTYGIRTGETILLTAQEGVGKTEVCHALEYHILKETKDNVGAIFLEEPKRRHLQAIAGLQLRKPVHLPDSGCSASEIAAALATAVGNDDRLHIYSHFGSADPDDLIDTIRFLVAARACRFVILDHITMAVSGLAGESERRALDYLSTRLEMMVKELDFSLIIVSHVNDDGLTRGSRNISKVADIRIDLTRDLKHSDPAIRSLMNVLVSKNRFCGRTGPAGQLVFDPQTYTLSENIYDASPANDNSRIDSMVA